MSISLRWLSQQISLKYLSIVVVFLLQRMIECYAQEKPDSLNEIKKEALRIFIAL